MTRPFDITAVSNDLTLDAKGRGKKIFTVTNKSQQALRAKLSVFHFDTAKAGWITVAGDAVRSWAATDGVQQVEVNVAVPPGTPPGKLRMRLDAISENRPEEDYTEGPEISVVIPAVAEERKKEDVPWWVWLIIALVVLTIVGVGAWLALRKTDPSAVPVVVGGGGSSAPRVAPTEPAGFVRLQLKHGGTFLDADHCSNTIGLSGRSEWEQGACQLWKFVPAGDGWSRLQLKHSGQFLDADHCTPKIGLNPGSDFDGGGCQLWKFVPAGGGWSRLQLKHGGQFLDADHCGSPVALNPGSDFEDGACQLWRIVPAGTQID